MAVYYLLLISLAGLGFFLTGNRKTQKKDGSLSGCLPLCPDGICHAALCHRL